MAKIVGMNRVLLPEDETEASDIRGLTQTYISGNPGIFRGDDLTGYFFNVAEFDVMLNYIYDLQDRGYTKYVEGFGSQEWIDEFGQYYPRPTPPEPTGDVRFSIHIGCDPAVDPEAPMTVFMEMCNVCSEFYEPCSIPDGEIHYGESGVDTEGICGPQSWERIQQMAADWMFSYETIVSRIE